MKPLFITGMIISFALTTALAMAADQKSLKLGEDLFHDPNLGGSTNQMSCSSCHAEGYRLQNAATHPDLLSAIRLCLINELGGSNKNRIFDMPALRDYALSLAAEAPTALEHSTPETMNGFRPGGPRPGVNRSNPAIAVKNHPVAD
jgi:cytochrome c peroxidase